MVCVLPILMMDWNSSDLACSACCSFFIAGSSRSSISTTAAMCITVGKVSLELAPLLTWSFGWTILLSPNSPPRISIARFAMTSLAFMLDWVPEPVCHTTSGKWSISFPSATSPAASTIAFPTLLSSTPRSIFTCAAAPLRIPKARTTGSGMRSLGPPILKFIVDRWVWAPQYLSDGTSSGPNVSYSVRVVDIRRVTREAEEDKGDGVSDAAAERVAVVGFASWATSTSASTHVPP